ncbi:MAG: penicillin acylase family protein [Deltaproteobacteria bacterium]|nr:penicillin acylase family protein [Deltaproteobacteria bacterium]MBN2844991.1 penicillin acylase family protein [Deltaproteobacteria bacterium]
MKQKYIRFCNITASLGLAFLLVIGFITIIGTGSSDSDRKSTVEITRDDKGVWFISGEEEDSLYDVFAAMGYAVATDRLWQAETFRRTARGRLAEIFGADYVEQDVLVRTTGYSDQELEDGFDSLDSESKNVIKGYVKGFNKRISEVRADPALLPFEFYAVGDQLGIEFFPEDWTPEDVMALAALMFRNFDPEAQKMGQIDNAALYQGLTLIYGGMQGAAMFEDLRWTNDPDALTYIPKGIGPLESKEKAPSALMENPPSIPDVREVAKNMAAARSRIEENLKKIGADIKMGSYAWVVSGDKTDSGNPIIYSGPQMGFSVPSIILEGSIRAGGLDVSGMAIAGLPAIVIGRTPHHAWSMQVGHARTVDYYFEAPSAVTLDRMETIHVAGDDDVILPVWRTAHGPVVNPLPYDPATYVPDPENPIISWKYSHWEYEFQAISAWLKFARAESMDDFGEAIELVPVSQHFCYADRDGNIAYWMSGRTPVRSYGEWRLPQGAVGTPLEWDAAVLIPRSTDRNTDRGYYCGWNNKTNAGYENSLNNLSYFFGPFHRAHVVDDYLSENDDLTFDDVRDLALNIATTDSFGGGGNPWKFAADYFTNAVNNEPFDQDRADALDLLDDWDGHFVDGGSSEWPEGEDRADAWILMDAWIREVLDLTFEELVPLGGQNDQVLFNVLLHDLLPGGIENYYDWYLPYDSYDEIIVEALDNVLDDLGATPWGEDARGAIVFNHDLLGPVWEMPFSSRSTYAHCVEFGGSGPVGIESMFPLGESGTILMDEFGAPDFDPNFLSMTDVYDDFSHREFPLFTP